MIHTALLYHQLEKYRQDPTHDVTILNHWYNCDIVDSLYSGSRTIFICFQLSPLRQEVPRCRTMMKKEGM